MKIFRLFPFTPVIFLALASCDHDVSMKTVVHENGELDKTIVVDNKHKDGYSNVLGISEKTGWKKTIVPGENQSDSSEDEAMIFFQKTFLSQDEANAELASPSDTLFRVTSTFEKKFRWFYTYIYYADTYQALNRMTLPPDDYIAKEDYAFIERLPAEGEKISKADSLYLEKLTEKIFEVYGTRAIYEELHDLGLRTIRENNLDNRWIDTLNKHKENIYKIVIRKKDSFYPSIFSEDKDFMFDAMQSLGIPLTYDEFKKIYHVPGKQFDTKVNHISFAYGGGKYQHQIEMPWKVIRTNADSVSGNQLFWEPPAIKFLLTDYTMYAEARRLNYWAVGVLIALLGFTGYLFFRKRNSG